MDWSLRPLARRVGLDAVARYLANCALGHPSVRPFLPARLAPGTHLYDLHCHTRVSDGAADAGEILRQVGARRLVDGLAITDHPWTLAADGKTRVPNPRVLHHSYAVAERVERLKVKGHLPASFVTFPGSVEWAVPLRGAGTARGGRGKHARRARRAGSTEIVTLGLPRTFVEDHGGLARIRGWSAVELVDRVHADGGLAILAHPFYFVAGGSDLALLRVVDAVEVLNHTTGIWFDRVLVPLFATLPGGPVLARLQVFFGYFNWRACLLGWQWRDRKALAGVSDAHIPGHAGAACTACPAPLDPGDPVEALRRAFRRRETRGLLNPRWEAQANPAEIFPQIRAKWGAEVTGVVARTLRTHPWLLPVLDRFTIPLRYLRPSTGR